MQTRYVSFNGETARVWEAGDGPPVLFLAGFGGLPRWIPFLDRLAASRRVIVPALPGFPGALGHERLDDRSDWTAATLAILEQSTPGPVPLIASSVSAPLALEAAVARPDMFSRIVLSAPFGVWDGTAEVSDLWAQPPGPDHYAALLCKRADAYARLWQRPADADEVAWQVLEARSREAAARYLWPLNDTGIRKRAWRLRAPMLLLRGEDDALVPASALELLKAATSAPVQLKTLADAGHLLELDAPDRLAALALEFLSPVSPP